MMDFADQQRRAQAESQFGTQVGQQSFEEQQRRQQAESQFGTQVGQQAFEDQQRRQQAESQFGTQIDRQAFEDQQRRAQAQAQFGTQFGQQAFEDQQRRQQAAAQQQQGLASLSRTLPLRKETLRASSVALVRLKETWAHSNLRLPGRPSNKDSPGYRPSRQWAACKGNSSRQH